MWILSATLFASMKVKKSKLATSFKSIQTKQGFKRDFSSWRKNRLGAC